jgi:hypothetical protein
MRHYDRGAFRQLNHGDRFRDYEFLADDEWAEPKEPAALEGESRSEPSRGDRLGRGSGREPVRDWAAATAKWFLDAIFYLRRTVRRAVHAVGRGIAP